MKTKDKIVHIEKVRVDLVRPKTQWEMWLTKLFGDFSPSYSTPHYFKRCSGGRERVFTSLPPYPTQIQ